MKTISSRSFFHAEKHQQTGSHRHRALSRFWTQCNTFCCFLLLMSNAFGAFGTCTIAKSVGRDRDKKRKVNEERHRMWERNGKLGIIEHRLPFIEKEKEVMEWNGARARLWEWEWKQVKTSRKTVEYYVYTCVSLWFFPLPVRLLETNTCGAPCANRWEQTQSKTLVGVCPGFDWTLKEEENVNWRQDTIKSD